MSCYQPLVSVIMNCYNSETYLKEAIESVYSQTYTNWEIIFLDNASTDNSAAIAKKFGEKIKYFRNDKTVSLGKARNSALSQAKGELIGFLDCDDLWFPSKLEKQVKTFIDNPRTGLVFSDVVNVFQKDKFYYRQFSMLKSLPPRGNIFGYLLLKYGVSFPTVLLRADVLKTQDQWFDESFQHSTDYDLFLRISYKWDCDYVNEPLAIYRIHQSIGQSLFGKYEGEERLRTIQKLCSLFPEIRSKYAGIIRDCSRNIAVIKARSLWKRNMLLQARKELLPYAWHPKIIMILISTILPYEWVMRKWIQCLGIGTGQDRKPFQSMQALLKSV